MCTLAAFVGMSPALPLLVAANRDEFLDRPASDPAVIAVDPVVFAGQDLSAGGTWFGINQFGMVVGLLNRRRAGGPDLSRRSRGLLCLEILQTASPSDATRRLEGLDPNLYNGFNLLVADRRQAFVATPGATEVQITHLPPGVHLLTNLELNDATCPRIAKSSKHFAALDLRAAPDAAELVEPLRASLADHSTALDPRTDVIDTLCVHKPGYGTRSASIVALDRQARPRWWQAAGPPCSSAFVELALPAPNGS